MKTKINRSLAYIVMLATLLGIAAPQPARSQDGPAVNTPEWVAAFNHQPISETLITTYRILGDGNRNYQGHRVNAMAEIKEAATLLNIELPPPGKGAKADQTVSDARLTLSSRLLDQLHSRLADQQEALQHIDKAMNHLSRAMKIRAAVAAAEAEADEEELAAQAK